MTDSTPDPDEQLLDEVQHDIDEARRKAQEHGTIPNPHHAPTFIDPDGDGEAEGDEANAPG